MLSYRDMTFCPHYKTCKQAQGCSRCLTPEVKKRAKQWWGGDDPPIAVFVEPPSCYEPTTQLTINGATHG